MIRMPLFRRLFSQPPTRAVKRLPRRRLTIEPLEERLVPAVMVDFKAQSDWGSGFTGQMAITNLDSTPVNGWKLEFDFARNIDSIWNARIVSRVGSHYVLEDAGYNATIGGNATVSFGYNGSPGNLAGLTPANYVFNGLPVGGGGGGGSGETPPTLSINDVSVLEGDGPDVLAQFAVTLSRASTQTVTVNFATRDGTAKAGSDYTAASGTLTFAAGQTAKTVTVAVKADEVMEMDENYYVNLSSPTNATLADGEGIGTIRDDDAPPDVNFNYGEALQKALFFYEANRSGDLPANYRIDWRGDSAMNDGADVGLDLTGGYYDAGDHVKFGLPMTSSMTLLAWGLVQYPQAYLQSGQLDRIREGVRWGTDWIMKAHPSPNVFYGQVGRGDLDHAAWVPPEVMQMARPAYRIDTQRPGSDLAGEAAASLASAYMAFKDVDPAYAAELLRHARELYNFADTYRGKYSDSITDAASYYNSYSGYHDELVWGAAWLYKATGEQAYLDKAENLYAQHFAGQTMTWTHSWDDKRYGAAVLLAQLTGKPVYKADAERWLDYWSVGINGGATRISYTPGGLAFLNGWGSLRYAATTSFLALIYGDTVRDYSGRYHDFAKRQINYMLGQNPNNRSYVVGFGLNPPKFPHHRGASGVWDGNVNNPSPNRHILYGALVGGPESADDNDYHDERSNYISNEVALDYNAGFTGAVARLFQEYGGQPLASFPIPDVRDPEYFVQASINNQGSTFTEIRALLNNRSAWPARLSSNLGFRYFLDLSEVYAAGYSVNDVEAKSYYANGSTLSGLQPWDAARHIYFVEVSFAGTIIGPGAGLYQKETQVRFQLKNGLPASAWDPTNDWSFQGLASGRDNLSLSRYIPVYEGSQKLTGDTPGGAPIPGTPALSVDNVSVTEGNTGSRNATFTVRLSAPSMSPVAVNYTTANATAAAGSDYASASGILNFAPGVTALTINVAVLGDTLVEGNETFKLVLSSPVNATLASSQGTGTIIDDDAPVASGISVQFIKRNDWGAGFVADMKIKNNTNQAINGWTLEFDWDREITSIWNARKVRRTGLRYVIQNESWNGTILPGQEVTFGFQGVTGNITAGPTNITLNGVPVGP